MKEKNHFKIMVNCAFSGHRYGISGLDLNLLDRVVLNLIKTGAKNFYCGMAVGFDMAAAETVIRYKKDYDVRLFACIPCDGQNEKFSDLNRRRYDYILENCDGEIILAPEYSKGCMHRRDRFLVDNCDVLVCFLRKSRGGTYYTVNYAKSLGKKIIEV